MGLAPTLGAPVKGTWNTCQWTMHRRINAASPKHVECWDLALGWSLFARRYWGNPIWFLFLRLFICLNSAGNLVWSEVDSTHTREPLEQHLTCNVNGPLVAAIEQVTQQLIRRAHFREPLEQHLTCNVNGPLVAAIEQVTQQLIRRAHIDALDANLLIVFGVQTTLRQTKPRSNLSCNVRSNVECSDVLHFTPINVACYVLPRPASRVIHHQQ